MKEKIYLSLAGIKYLLNQIISETRFGEKLTALLRDHSELPLHYMGFPEAWETDAFWEIEPLLHNQGS